jgi:hypothetical protein
MHLRARQKRLELGKCQQWTVQVKRLDELHCPPPDLIKIDVEGYEYEVLEGMGKLIPEYKPAFCIELHGVDLTMVKEIEGNIFRLLTSYGYRLFQIESRQKVSSELEPPGGHIFAVALPLTPFLGCSFDKANVMPRSHRQL